MQGVWVSSLVREQRLKKKAQNDKYINNSKGIPDKILEGTLLF